MKLFKVKAQSPGRILNIWNKAYTFDENSECFIPESEAGWLPLTYKIIWEIEDKTKNIPTKEIKKVVKDKKDIKKVKNEKLDVKKTKSKTEPDEVKK